MIQIIDTSVTQRHIHNTNAWVETDIVDASDNYQFFTKYDTVKYAIDPSIEYERKHKNRYLDHLYVDPSISERAMWEFENLYSTDGKLDRSKFPF
ncbi:MAG: hypothetical protein [Wendovervirus sonii]|uniref:Uncharacterized protein n=1 Tax=phage Lak_Megaphage_Sonny TaxID=3109229 RepID=A0ABZ0Z3G2_9CAUD|nr:MAG: hypothetical protein [phage Lak_Megaphage_Sonny]